MISYNSLDNLTMNYNDPIVLHFHVLLFDKHLVLNKKKTFYSKAPVERQTLGSGEPPKRRPLVASTSCKRKT